MFNFKRENDELLTLYSFLVCFFVSFEHFLCVFCLIWTFLVFFSLIWTSIVCFLSHLNIHCVFFVSFEHFLCSFLSHLNFFAWFFVPFKHFLCGFLSHLNISCVVFCLIWTFLVFFSLIWTSIVCFLSHLNIFCVVFCLIWTFLHGFLSHLNIFCVVFCPIWTFFVNLFQFFYDADSKRPTFSRSEEVGHQSPASVQRALLHKQMSKDSTDGSVSSSGYGGNKAHRFDNSHLASFVDGLGPGQVVGRQVLALPCLGQIHLQIKYSKGSLEVEPIRAKGLVLKGGNRQLPGTDTCRKQWRNKTPSTRCLNQFQNTTDEINRLIE